MIPRIIANASQDRWLAESGELVHKEVSCVPGAMYRFCGQPGPSRPDGSQTWIVEPGDYRCIGLGKNVRTWQDMVVYVGVGGRDDGVLWFCTIADWAENFTLILEESHHDP